MKKRFENYIRKIVTSALPPPFDDSRILAKIDVVIAELAQIVEASERTAHVAEWTANREHAGYFQPKGAN